MRPLSIVHALPFFDPAMRFGNPVSQLLRLCRALSQRGHRVSVVTTELGIGLTTPRQQWVDREGFRVWYARAHRFGRYPPYYCPCAAAALQETLRDSHVLSMVLSFTHMNIAGREAALRLGVPYVYSPRMCLDPVRLRERRLSKTAFLALYERAIIRDAAAIHVLTESERDHVLRQGARPQQCVLVPNGAEFDEDTIFPDGAIFRKHLGLHRDAPLVLSMGRLHRARGLDLLLEAFARVAASMPAARLVVAGPDDGARPELEMRADRLGILQAVKFTGPLEANLKLAAFRAADVFALVAYADEMPNAVLEAAAAGTPVVVSGRCNLPDVAAYRAGRIVGPTVDALAGALLEMLADRAGLKAIGENGRRMVRERFAFSTVVDRIEQMYRDVVAGANQPRTATTRAA